MRRRILRALKAYLKVTSVMLINIAVLVAIYWLLQRGGLPWCADDELPWPSWDEVPGLRVANGDRAVVEQNLSFLGFYRLRGKPADLGTILKFCGKPDGYDGDVRADLVVVYQYNRFGPKDWVAMLCFKEGRLAQIGYAPSTLNDLSWSKAWDIPEAEIPSFP